MMIMLIGGLLSGAYLPLQLWPDSMQTFLLLQPFAGYADIPIRLYLGSMTPADALQGLVLQISWIAVFIAAGRHLLKRRLATVIIQGG